jgi:hypothetical protein
VYESMFAGPYICAVWNWSPFVIEVLAQLPRDAGAGPNTAGTRSRS